MSLSERVDGELESVKGGMELVGRFRRFLDPDLGFATREEVAALSEYLARVDALVHALEQAAVGSVYVVRSSYAGVDMQIFSSPDAADGFVRKLLLGDGFQELLTGKDELGRTEFLSGGLCLASIEAVIVDDSCA